MFEGRARAEGRDSEQPPHLRRGAHQALESFHRTHRIHSRWRRREVSRILASTECGAVCSPPDPQGSNDVKEPPHQLVAGEIRCIECRCLWVLPQERWRVFLTDEDQPEPVAYCPACAKREFD